MGFLARITNAVKGITATDGAHQINKTEALQATHVTAINPNNNANNWDTVRTAPIANKPQYFDKGTADAMWQLRKQTTEQAKQSERVYKHLGKIEGNDARVHRAHKRYLGNAADAEFSKIQGNAKLARHLHALRSHYAQLGTGVDRAEQSAGRRIEQLKTKIRESR